MNTAEILFWNKRGRRVQYVESAGRLAEYTAVRHCSGRQTIRPINQVVWQLSNSCSPMGRTGRSREEEGVSLWEEGRVQRDGRTFACKLKSPVFWAYYPGPESVGGMLGRELGRGLVILRRAPFRVQLCALCIEQSGNLHRTQPGATCRNQPVRSKEPHFFTHVFDHSYIPWFKCVCYLCLHKNRTNTRVSFCWKRKLLFRIAPKEYINLHLIFL